MMIGPAPMMRMDLRSARLGIVLLHHGREAVEQVADVMGSRGGLWMALEAESRFVGARQPLQRAVEQADVRRAQVGGQGLLVDREAVVLAGDADAAVVEV